MEVMQPGVILLRVEYGVLQSLLVEKTWTKTVTMKDEIIADRLHLRRTHQSRRRGTGQYLDGHGIEKCLAAFSRLDKTRFSHLPLAHLANYTRRSGALAEDSAEPAAQAAGTASEICDDHGDRLQQCWENAINPTRKNFLEPFKIQIKKQPVL